MPGTPDFWERHQRWKKEPKQIRKKNGQIRINSRNRRNHKKNIISTEKWKDLLYINQLLDYMEKSEN